MIAYQASNQEDSGVFPVKRNRVWWMRWSVDANASSLRMYPWPDGVDAWMLNTEFRVWWTARVEAASEADAVKKIIDSFDGDVTVLWRFVHQKPDDWYPDPSTYPLNHRWSVRHAL